MKPLDDELLDELLDELDEELLEEELLDDELRDDELLDDELLDELELLLDEEDDDDDGIPAHSYCKSERATHPKNATDGTHCSAALLSLSRFLPSKFME